MTASAILSPVKPCKNCGPTERNKFGACIVCDRKSKRKYYHANALTVSKQKSQHYLENRELMLEKCRAWAIANSEKKKQAQKKYRDNNKAKIKSGNDAWISRNKDLKRSYTINRRAKASTSGTLSKDLAQKLFALQRGKCACCGLKLGENYHVDHIMPIALGGSNTDDNIQLLRKECNLKKNAKHPIDFMQSKGFLL